jgi:hypothetical protein
MPIVALALIGAGVVAACGGNRIDRFHGKEPALALETFFAGSTRGAGVQQDRFGKLMRHFTIEAEGAWNPATQTLDLVEVYRFDDGSVDRLEWRIVALGGGRYRGTERRVEGEAVGKQAGNAFHWTYTRSVPLPDGERRFDFDDWFWLTADGVLVCRAEVSRFGITLGSLSVFYRRI